MVNKWACYYRLRLTPTAVPSLSFDKQERQVEPSSLIRDKRVKLREQRKSVASILLGE